MSQDQSTVSDSVHIVLTSATGKVKHEVTVKEKQK